MTRSELPFDSAVATGKGDDGTTGLLFGGARVRKDDPRTDSYGTVDEAVAALGLARAELGAVDHDDPPSPRVVRPRLVRESLQGVGHPVTWWVLFAATLPYYPHGDCMSTREVRRHHQQLPGAWMTPSRCLRPVGWLPDERRAGNGPSVISDHGGRISTR